MSRTEIVKARIDGRLKKAALKELDSLGLSASEFIRIKFAELVKNRSLLDLEPNKETLEAIKSLKRGEGTPYNDVDEMFKAAGL